MNYARNVSTSVAAAISVLLIKQGVAYSATPVDGPSVKRRVEISVSNTPQSIAALDLAYKQSSAATVEVETGIDSNEQSGNYMNGTLSNLAPGVAVTIQVSPETPYPELSEPEAVELLQSLLLPVSAQGWACKVAIGDDLDHPA